jgi:hypothetical protein
MIAWRSGSRSGPNRKTGGGGSRADGGSGKSAAREEARHEPTEDERLDAMEFVARALLAD